MSVHNAAGRLGGKRSSESELIQRKIGMTLSYTGSQVDVKTAKKSNRRMQGAATACVL